METGMTAFAVERRASRRWARIEEHGIVLARVRPGYDVSLIDISPGGMLIECARRLMPGAGIELQLQREGRGVEIIRGRVLRCSIVRLRPDAVNYRGAIAFERRIEWLADDDREYSVPSAESDVDPAHWEPVTRQIV